MTAAGRITVARITPGDVILVEPSRVTNRYTSTTRKLTGRNGVVALRVLDRQQTRTSAGRRSVTLTTLVLADPVIGTYAGETLSAPPSQTFALAPAGSSVSP